MSKLMHRLWSEDAGQDIAEYAVMLAVILVLVVGTVRLIGAAFTACFWFPGEAAAEQLGVRMSH